MDKYSIIIPIHNEINTIQILLESLIDYSLNGHEIIIIDDGSTDGSLRLLKKSNFIKIIQLKKNKGKGFAIREGLKKANNDRVIIFDGDMELHPSDISKLMILDRNESINCVMGYRFKCLNPLKSSFDWGNFMFTSFFNIIFLSNHKDILCCAKSFFLSDINLENLKSNGFDIDVELTSLLTFNNKKNSNVLLDYNRRTLREGKKLQISDGWAILLRIIKMMRY